MTTEDGPGVPARDGSGVPARDGSDEPDRVAVTKLPARGTVLVGARAPPEVPTERCVDVRPGPVATFDGDRLELSLTVVRGDERRRFTRHELPALERTVASLLVDAGRAAARDRVPEVVRFGDRAACRNVLPSPAVTTIERRLGAVACQLSGTLLTWTSAGPGSADYRTYDVVIDGVAAERG